jgi:hypothetical protein
MREVSFSYPQAWFSSRRQVRSQLAVCAFDQLVFMAPTGLRTTTECPSISPSFQSLASHTPVTMQIERLLDNHDIIALRLDRPLPSMGLMLEEHRPGFATLVVPEDRSRCLTG